MGKVDSRARDRTGVGEGIRNQLRLPRCGNIHGHVTTTTQANSRNRGRIDDTTSGKQIPDLSRQVETRGQVHVETTHVDDMQRQLVIGQIQAVPLTCHRHDGSTCQRQSGVEQVASLQVVGDDSWPHGRVGNPFPDRDSIHFGVDRSNQHRHHRF